jgi:hypothetical protein
MRKFFLKFGLIALLIVTGSILASAQVDFGSIIGSVTDPSGALVNQATITVVNDGTNATHTVQTEANGGFQVEKVPAGVYTVTVSSKGFRDYRAKVEVAVGGHITVKARLAVSSDDATVEVVVGGNTSIDTQTQEIAEVITPEQVHELPSLTRNAYDFVALSGNVSQGDSAQGHNQNIVGRGVGFSLNGQRSSGTEILLDGVENTELFSDSVGINVPIESVGEYRVLTSNFEAQYGRASGGVVNVITASGTNALHGTVSEFNRLAAYTANTVTNAQAGNSKGGYTRNQPSFFVSGPVVKDKLFFAGGLEILKVRSNATVSRLVPTPDLIALTSPATQAFMSQFGQTFQFAKTITNTGAGTPFASIAGSTPVFGLVNFQVPQDAGGGVPQDTYNYTLRSDFNYSDKTQFFCRHVAYSQTQSLGALYYNTYSQYDAGTESKDYAVLGGFTHAFTPSLLTTGRVSFSRIDNKYSQTKASLITPALYFAGSALVNGYSIDLPGNKLSSLPFGGPQNVIQWNQDVNLTRERHSYAAGTQLMYIQTNRLFAAYAEAVEALATAGSDPKGYNGFYTGTLGLFEAAVNPQGKYPGQTITTPDTQPNFGRSYRFHDWAAYVQDSWHALPRLTVNYGVRYEFYGVQHNNNQKLDSNYYFGSGSDYATRIRTGSVQVAPDSSIGRLWNPTYGAVSPRIGFAYDLSGNGRTVIRGGWGISYERNFGNVTFNIIQNPPNYAVVVLQPNVTNGTTVPISTSNLGTLGQSSGTVTLPNTSLRQVNPNIKTAQSQFWSFTAERQIARDTVVGADYLGARGIHLYDIKNINGWGSGNYLAGDSYATSGGTRLQTRQYSNINSRGSDGDSYYEALNLHVSTHNTYRSGLSATANYTWGHSIDDVSSAESDSAIPGGGTNPGNLGYTNPFNPSYDRGNGDLDIRQRFVVAPIYETPWFKDQHNLTGRLLGNWLATGIFSVRSGLPFTFYDSTHNFGDGYNNARYFPSTPLTKWKYNKASGAVASATNEYYLAPNLPVGKAVVNSSIGGYSNWAFPIDAPKRNSFYGPGAWNVDLAVSKKFAVWEKVNVEVRAEGFDVLNHHNLYVLEKLDDAANFRDASRNPTAPSIYAKKGGVNGSTTEERRFGQLALKINF